MNKGSILLKNCRVFSPEEIPGRHDILIISGKIKKIARNIRAGFDMSALDCKGNIAAPGFIDVHAQGAGGAYLLDDTKRALRIISSTLAKTGVTSFLSTTVAVPGRAQEHLKDIADAVESGLPGAQTLGSHLEGPFINIKKKGMIRADTIRKPSAAFLGYLIRESRGTIRMMTVAPELPGNLGLIKIMKRKGIVASLGHTMAGYGDAVKGIRAGITHATHLFNAMSPINHRDPGSPGAVFDSKNVTAQVIVDGKHLVPPVIRMIYKLLPKGRICIITDSMPNLGLPDGKYTYFGNEYTSVNGTCYYKDGTLIGTAVPLNEMARRFMSFTGASLSEVFAMLSLSSAKTLGIKKGRLAPGFDGDIVVLNRRLDVLNTVVLGRKVY